MSAHRFARFARLTLVVTLAVILWGAYVRATGSGAGCGSHWPLCNGQVLPRAPAVETLIELSHRVSSGIALLLVVALVPWAFRRFPRRHPVRAAAVASLVLMLAEAGIGAGLVLFELVADNESMARALAMAAHLCNTFLLLAALALTARWAAAPERRPSLRARGPWIWAVALGLGGLMLVGASGGVTALGDTLHPGTTLEQALDRDLSATSTLLLRLRVVHPVLAVAVSLYVAALAYLLGLVPGAPRGAARPAGWLASLTFVQLAAGAVNYALQAPVWLQLTHLLLADLLWIFLVLLAAARAEAVR